MSYEYGRREAYAGNGASMPPPPPVAGSSYSRDGPSATYPSGYASSRDGGPSGGYSTGNDSYDNLSRGAPSGRYDKGPPASYERGYQEYGRPSSMTAASSGGAGASDYDRGNAPYAGQVHAPPTGYSDYPPGQYSSGKVYDERAHSGASYAADRRDGGGYYRQSSVEPAPRPSGYSDGASSYFARAPPSQYSSDRDRGTLDVPSHSSSRSGYPPAPEYGRRAEYGTSTGYERARTPPSYGDQYHQSQSAAPHQQQYQQQQQRSQHHQYEQSHHPRSDNHRRHDDYPSPPPRHHPQQHSHHSHPPPQDDHSRYPQAPPYSDSRSHHDSRDHTRERDDGRDHGRDYGRERGSLSAASVGHSTYRRRSLSPPSLSPSRRGPPPPPRGRSDRPEPDYSKWKHKPKSQTDPNFKPEMAQSLFVGNLPYHFTEEDLQTAFGRAGRVTNVALKMDPVSRQNKGFCFVRFASHEDAANAFHMYSKEPYEGRMFRLDWDKGVEQKLSQQGYTAAAAVASRRSRSRSPDHRHHVQHRQYQHQHQHRRHEADHHGSLSQSSVSPLSRRYRRSRSRSRSPTGHRRSSDRDGSSERTGHRQELSSGESVERKGGEEDSLQEKVAEEEADSVGEEAASMSKQASAPEEDKASDGAFAKAAEIDAGDAAALAILMGE